MSYRYSFLDTQVAFSGERRSSPGSRAFRATAPFELWWSMKTFTGRMQVEEGLSAASQNSCANLPPYVCENVRSLTPEFQPVLPSNRPIARRNAHAACANGRDFARRSAAPVTPLPWNCDPAHPIKAQETQPRRRRLQSRSTGSLQRSRDDKSDETNFSDLRREILGTFCGSDEHGTKGGFGGFGASCEREIADQTGSFALATWSILTNVRWQICTEIL